MTVETSLANGLLPLGGFFALEEPGPGGMARHWGIRADLAWENATSAVAALLSHLKPAVVWLPGYICASILSAVPSSQRRFYAVSEDLRPDVESLAGVARGDVVLAVNYFGRSPGPAWHDFVARHGNLTFVEDCAQTLDTGEEPWGDWRLFSPRKLFGVPEGGLLVPVSARAHNAGLKGPSLSSDPAAAAARLAPMRLRRAEPMRNALWYPVYQAVEAAHTAGLRAMSAEALDLLISLDPQAMIAMRKANFARLAGRLAAVAMFKDVAPRYAPMGFPIVLPPDRRDGFLARLHAASIFPAVHWRDIAAPESFNQDHARSRSIATLPCDHRYGVANMDRLIDACLKALE